MILGILFGGGEDCCLKVLSSCKKRIGLYYAVVNRVKVGGEGERIQEKKRRERRSLINCIYLK